MDYEPPELYKASFSCPTCGRLTGQTWESLSFYVGRYGIATAQCQAGDCGEYSFWVGYIKRTQISGFLEVGSMVYPARAEGPVAHADMPELVLATYNEARNVLPHSPRASGALLRLALQQLMSDLGLPGRNLDSDIAALVKAGLRAEVQKALDTVRVVGNEAVHPGVIDTDDPQVVSALFQLLNYIVDDRISQPALIDQLFTSLPDGKRQAIDRRDGPT